MDTVWDSTDRIRLALDMNKWPNLGNRVMNLLVPPPAKKGRIYGLAEEPMGSRSWYFYFRTQLMTIRIDCEPSNFIPTTSNTVGKITPADLERQWNVVDMRYTSDSFSG